MAKLDLGRFEVLTFDCYGTLIDWETGIIEAAGPILADHGASLTDDDLLEQFAKHEAAIERGPYRSYRDVLAGSLRGMGKDLAVQPTGDELAMFAASVGSWPAFPDSASALHRLAARYRLGVITNCDDDQFATSARALDVTFDWVITAQQVRAYKPSLEPFERALALIGEPRDRILHVAQSLYHDHVPAKSWGLATAWVNRRHDRPGFGATPPVAAEPDLVVPDLRSLADLAAQ